MASTRTRRVGELIRQELAGLLTGRLRDPRVREVTITEVEMSPDLKKAHVYFACGADRAREVADGLEKAAGFIRRNLSQKVHLKFMPELVYHYDDSLDTGAAMDELFDSIIPDSDPDKMPEKTP